MRSTERFAIKVGTITLIALLLIFMTGITVTRLGSTEASSEGISKLKKLGDRIEGLDFNSGVFFGNVETCSDATTCIGTHKDDIIHGGVREQVFGLKGNDMIFGALDSRGNR